MSALPRLRVRSSAAGARARLAAIAVVLLASVSIWLVPSTSGAFKATVTNRPNTVGAASRFKCADTFALTANHDNAWFQYPLTVTGTTVTDAGSAANTGTFQPSGQHPVATAIASTACPSDSGNYYTPSSSSSQWISTSTQILSGSSPTTLSLAIWFQASAGSGGYLLGLNNSQTGGGTNYGRHMYLDKFGKVEFGTHSGSGFQMVVSPSAYTDGKWHQAVATMSPSTGNDLFIDGVRVSDSGYVAPDDNPGWWRIGWGPLVTWPNDPNDYYFTGGLRFAAAYKFVLSDTEIAAQYAVGKPGS